MTTFNEFKVEQSLLHKLDDFKETKGDRVSVRTDIAPEDYELIDKYIKQRGNDFNKSQFVRELMKDFINNTAFEKQSFKDLYFFMLVSKDDEPEIEIVGLLENNDFYVNIYRAIEPDKNKYNYIFRLEEFNEQNYKFFLNFYKNDSKQILYDVDTSIQKDFYEVKTRLKEVYFDFNIEDCFFTVVNINNYLDELQEGQYLCYENTHQGVLVLIDPEDSLKRTHVIVDWYYSNSRLCVYPDFIDSEEWNSLYYRIDNDELIKEYMLISEVYSYEHAINKRIELDKGNIEYLEQQLEISIKQLKTHEAQRDEYLKNKKK